MTNGAVTGSDLLNFLDAEAAAGRMHAGTASSRRSAVREVLQLALGDDWENTPFTSDHVPELLEKFTDARRSEFGSGTISSYQSNFRRTVELYSTRDDLADMRHDSRVSYRFQVRDSEVVEFTLPSDLTVAEAKRLARFITTLPLDAEE